jgi:hypothetical protein
MQRKARGDGRIVAHVAAPRRSRTQHHQSCLPQPASRHKHPHHHVNSNNTRHTLRALHRGAEQAMAGWRAARPRHIDMLTFTRHGHDAAEHQCPATQPPA